MIKTLLLGLLALTFLLYLHGAVPFYATPTLGQAVWTTGFAQSFINESIFSIHAKNFGVPEPAAIAFGLAGAWTTALFLKIGLHPADAYSAMVAFWLTIAFLSAYRIGRLFVVTRSFSIIGATLWITIPIIWAHDRYSMVSIGISLLPLYFLAALYLFLSEVESRLEITRKASFYILSCTIAVFMDGYSFMMFATGASIFAVWVFTKSPKQRSWLLYHALPIHVMGFGLAYLLYSLYIGKTHFEPAHLDFFRGWGVDLTFIVIPTKGMHLIPDLFDWSIPRSENDFFGDASVWTTTFSIPLFIATCWAWWKTKKTRNISTGLLLISIFGFYMSLGPSLKINSVKPPDQDVGSLMPAEYAIAPTGSALLSDNLPGFNNMRASYRWLALGILGGWLLLVLALSQKDRTTTVSAGFIAGLVIILNLPDLPRKWVNATENREMFLRIDTDLLTALKKILHQNEKVAFLPYRNDFLVNYLAARADIISYNIGGDKNLAEARIHWPETMRQFPMASVDPGFSNRVILLLARNEADVVILPYIDMLWAAHRWPYPVQFEEQLRPIVAELRDSGFVDVQERDYFAVARLARSAQDALDNQMPTTLCLAPVCLKQHDFLEETLSQTGVLKNGQLFTDGRQGFLLFGPYRPMNTGRYRLTIYGTGSMIDTAWVDVVSVKGTVRHAKFALSPGKQGHTPTLVDEFLVLESPVEDIEIRVFVGEQDVLRLDGYEIVPVDRLASPHGEAQVTEE